MANNVPRCRPGGAANKTVLALWLLLLACAATQSLTVDSIVSRRSEVPATPGAIGRSDSRYQPGRSPAEIPHLQVDTTTQKFRSTEEENSNADRFHALAPVLDESAVRAPIAQSRESAGLSALTAARLLQDWEVENIVLLATIDGAIHARDRKTGQHRWSLEIPDSPMIETVHHGHNRTAVDGPHPEDDYIFIVEPSKDGNLYIQHKNPAIGLQRLGISVRSLAATTPQFVDSPSLVTIAEQESTLYMIDGATGNTLKQFNSRRNFVNDEQDRSCRRINNFELDETACEPFGTLYLGRVQYTITISSGITGENLCTIKYSEWTPNTRDADLQSQYNTPMDNCHIQSYHNGRIIGMDRSKETTKQYRFTHTLSTPVARVFDVMRQAEDKDGSAPLVVLAQPAELPAQHSSQQWPGEDDHDRVFVNRTENGYWYAMSELSYPGVTSHATAANIFNDQSERRLLDFEVDSKDIVGVHFLSRQANVMQVPLTIGEAATESELAERAASDLMSTAMPQRHGSGLQSISAFKTPTIICTILAVLFAIGLRRKDKIAMNIQKCLQQLGIEITYTKPGQALSPSQSSPDVVYVTSPGADEQGERPRSISHVASKSSSSQPRSRAHSVSPQISDANGIEAFHDSASDSDGEDLDRIRSVSIDEEDEQDASGEANMTGENSNEVNPDGKKRKTKRGKRGGKGNKKKKTMKPEALDEDMSNVVSEVPTNGGLLQVGRLRVDTRPEHSLGHGSNGTTVFYGQLDERQVAVKRLIRSTNSLAAGEIKHLLSSDDHQNVIRYFGKEESQNFTYIALDLFTTSLDQVIEHAAKFPGLISLSDGLDVKDTLRQITHGVQHLHSLKLVHRDIKPQNVLVRPVKSSRPLSGPPKLQFVISDFGLCKKLDEGPGSYFAPTANHTAAGTTGWRAPELLTSTRSATNQGQPPSTSSESNPAATHSGNGTIIDSYSGKRATKAIDIFSLGCVFFYVMTQGCHPYDVGGTSLGRDLNIKENRFSTDVLRLHDYQFDADDLIMQMLQHDPRDRPDTALVLRHPYFWAVTQKLDFLCEVSDCYEKEKTLENPPSIEIPALEALASNVIGPSHDFLKALPKSFINEMGKQRKYTGSRMIDLLRVIRNKKNHFHDLPDDVKEQMLGGSVAGYFHFWVRRFPSLLINCHCLIVERDLVAKFKLDKYFV